MRDISISHPFLIHPLTHVTSRMSLHRDPILRIYRCIEHRSTCLALFFPYLASPQQSFVVFIPRHFKIENKL